MDKVEDTPDPGIGQGRQPCGALGAHIGGVKTKCLNEQNLGQLMRGNSVPCSRPGDLNFQQREREPQGFCGRQAGRNVDDRRQCLEKKIDGAAMNIERSTQHDGIVAAKIGGQVLCPVECGKAVERRQIRIAADSVAG